MISGVSRGGFTRYLASATPLFFVLLGSGCDPEGYPSDLKYPARTDIIVDHLKLRDEEMFYPDQPGQLDESIRNYQAKCNQDKKAETFDPNDRAILDQKKFDDITKSLEKRFGTPAEPRVQIADSGDPAVDKAFHQALKDLQLEKPALAEGSKLYRRHCLHCHGVTGNGRGPTAAWLHPHPRDYRKGQFKYISTGKDAPSRADLRRIVKGGVDNTSMPSFGLLPEVEVEHLISYVIHLSLRGQAEEAVMRTLLKKQSPQVDGEDVSLDVYVQDRVRCVVLQGYADSAVLQGYKGEDLLRDKGWAAANKAPPLTPQPTSVEDETTRRANIALGYKLFIGKDAGCLTCHKDFGRSSLYRYDFWGTVVQPRNLTAGLYRGGRRPIDFFWRIKGGITPSTMPKAPNELLSPDEKKQLESMSGDEKAKKSAALTEANIWRLVAFIQAVPYPAMLEVPIDPKDPTKTVRDAVYPTPVKTE